MFKSKYLGVGLVSIGVSVLVSTSFAHSPGANGDFEMTPPMKFEMEEAKALADDFGDASLAVRGVVNLVKLWSDGQPIRVCFYDGSQEQKEFFAGTAELWTTGTSLKFDFGRPYRACQNENSQDPIRVSFLQKGNWSYVGTDSMLAQVKSKVSLNIENFGQSTILHELGHALGFEHEHQSPEARCDDEFDWDKIIPWAQKNWGWDEATTRFNLSQLVAAPRLRTTPYDQHSIMHYRLPSWMYKKGEASRCYSEVGDKSISSLDRKAVIEAYPPDHVAAAKEFDERATQAGLQLGKSDLDFGKLSKVGAKIAEYLKFRKDNVKLVIPLSPELDETRSPDKLELSPCDGNKQTSVSCAIAADGSTLVIEANPRSP